MADRRIPFAYEAREWIADGIQVECFSAADPDDVRFRGRAVGLQLAPTVLVQLDDGRLEHWALGITRPARPITATEEVPHG